jgi:hypothetical protein
VGLVEYTGVTPSRIILIPMSYCVGNDKEAGNHMDNHPKCLEE